MHRDTVAVPVLAHAPVLLLHRLECRDGGHPVLSLAVGLGEILHLGDGEEILRVEGLEADEGCVAARLRRETEETLAFLALAGGLLAGRQLPERRGFRVDLHHEGELVAVAAVGGHAFEDRLPGRAAEEIVVDDEQGRDAVTLARVPDPAHHRLRIPRPHRPPHHVLHAAVRAGEGAAARGVERRHRRRGEAPEVRVADRGELGLGDERHGDVRAAGLGADAIRHAVGRPELATEVVVEEIRPERLRLAHDGRDPALLEEAPRLGIAAHVEATEENGEACAPELAGEVAAARVLVRLHAGEPDQHLDAVPSAFS